MQDPLDVRTAGDLRVTCQIVHIGWRDEATLIDLVTLEECRRDGSDLPAGSPLTLGFKASHLDEDRLEMEEVVSTWESNGAILTLDAADAAKGICYQFSDGREHLLLVLDERPPDRDRA